MAKGVKRPVEELIAEIDGKIEGFQAKINDLKSQRKELVEADRAAKVSALLDTLAEKGLSVEEAIEKLIQ